MTSGTFLALLKGELIGWQGAMGMGSIAAGLAHVSTFLETHLSRKGVRSPSSVPGPGRGARHADKLGS